jgi:anti-sigma factor RsiW
MKSHSEIKELLALYRDLDAASRREVDQHVQECAACAEQLAAYQTMDWELAKLTDPRPDTRLRDEFYSAIGARDRQAHLNWP